MATLSRLGRNCVVNTIQLLGARRVETAEDEETNGEEVDEEKEEEATEKERLERLKGTLKNSKGEIRTWLDSRD